MPPQAGTEKKAHLRDWLEDLLNTGQVPGLKWANKQRGIFRMVWRNGNNRAWAEEDGYIFKEWAIHKGHYKPNPDGTWPEPEFPTWKSRLRCALNRCNDINEIKQEQRVDWKMFQMFPKERNPTSAAESPFLDLEPGGSEPVDMRAVPALGNAADAVPPIWNAAAAVPPVGNTATVCPPPVGTVAIGRADHAVTNGAAQPSCSTDMYVNIAFPPNIPAVVTGLKATPHSSYEEKKPTEQKERHFDIFSSLDSETLAEFTTETDQAQLATFADELMEISLANAVEIGYDESREMPDSLSLLSLKSEPRVHDTCLWLRYRSTVIGKCIIKDEKGCRIYNPEQANVPALAPGPGNELNGQHISLPDPKVFLPSNDDQLYCEDIAKLLEYMDNGTQIITNGQGDIYARRLSRCKVYCANASMNATEPYKLPRHQRVKVFDYADFQRQLLKAKTEGGKVPSVTVLFSLGQMWSWTKSINKMCISATVANAKCWYDLRKFMSSRRRYPGKAVEDTAIEVSLENLNLGQ